MCNTTLPSTMLFRFTGSGTGRVNAPLLTVRLDDVAFEPPLRVVLESGGRLPATARILRDTDAPTVLVYADDIVPDYADTVQGFAVRRVPGGLDMAAVLAQQIGRASCRERGWQYV